MNKFLPVQEFEAGNNKKYEIKVIQNSAIYAKKVDKYLPRLYYLVAWKSYLKRKKYLRTILGSHVPVKDGQQPL